MTSFIIYDIITAASYAASQVKASRSQYDTIYIHRKLDSLFYSQHVPVRSGTVTYVRRVGKVSDHYNQSIDNAPNSDDDTTSIDNYIPFVTNLDPFGSNRYQNYIFKLRPMESKRSKTPERAYVVNQVTSTSFHHGYIPMVNDDADRFYSSLQGTHTASHCHEDFLQRSQGKSNASFANASRKQYVLYHKSSSSIHPERSCGDEVDQDITSSIPFPICTSASYYEESPFQYTLGLGYASVPNITGKHHDFYRVLYSASTRVVNSGPSSLSIFPICNLASKKNDLRQLLIGLSNVNLANGIRKHYKVYRSNVGFIYNVHQNAQNDFIHHNGTCNVENVRGHSLTALLPKSILVSSEDDLRRRPMDVINVILATVTRRHYDVYRMIPCFIYNDIQKVSSDVGISVSSRLSGDISAPSPLKHRNIPMQINSIMVRKVCRKVLWDNDSSHIGRIVLSSTTNQFYSHNYVMYILLVVMTNAILICFLGHDSRNALLKVGAMVTSPIGKNTIRYRRQAMMKNFDMGKYPIIKNTQRFCRKAMIKIYDMGKYPIKKNTLRFSRMAMSKSLYMGKYPIKKNTLRFSRQAMKNNLILGMYPIKKNILRLSRKAMTKTFDMGKCPIKTITSNQNTGTMESMSKTEDKRIISTYTTYENQPRKISTEEEWIFRKESRGRSFHTFKLAKLFRKIIPCSLPRL